MSFTLEDIAKLTPKEVADFYTLRGLDPYGKNLSLDDIRDVANTGTKFTLPLIDLYLSRRVPRCTTPYSRTAILSEPNLVPLGTALGLQPDDPQLSARITRILRFQGCLIDDLQFTLPSGPIPLAEIVCGRLKVDRVLTEIRSSECTPLSEKVSQSLIQIASTRIFDNPAQSILELPVNSIDAYQVLSGSTRKVGKFGMGFFSLFYWILTRPGNMYLTTTYLNPLGNLEKYMAMFYTENNQLVLMLFREVPDIAVTGTRVEILSQNLPLAEFTKQLEKLNFVQTVSINKPGPNPVAILTTPTTIVVQDWATGIPLETFLSSVLIPSISTKQIPNVSYTPQIGVRTGITKSEEAHFAILLGQIAIVSFEYLGCFTYILQLNELTPVPVSRDDILLGLPLVRQEFEMNVEALLQISLQDKLAPQGLFEGLLKYKPSLLEYVNFLKETYIRPVYDMVPAKLINYYETFGDIVGTDDPLDYRVEDAFLTRNPGNKQIFYGKDVYPTPLPSSSGGSSRMLFVEDLTDEVDDVSLALSFGGMNLLPVRLQSSQVVNQDLLLRITPLDLETRGIVYNVLVQLDSLPAYYDFKPGEPFGTDLSTLKAGLTRTFTVAYLHIPSTNRKLATMYLGFLSQLRPKVAYGGSKPSMRVYPYTQSTFHVQSMFQKTFETWTLDLFQNLIPIAVENNMFIIFPINSVPFLFGPEDEFNMYRDVAEYVLIKLLRDIIQNVGEIPPILNFWRRELNTKSVRDVLFKKVMIWHVYPEFDAIIHEPIKTFIRVYRDVSQRAKTIPGLPNFVLTLTGDVYRYSLAQLMQFLYRVPFQAKDFFSILPELSQTVYPEKFPLQALEIAINEGTTKGYVAALLTETFQNSVDAIRVKGSGTLSLHINRTGDRIAYQIIDTVGIPPGGLLALSVPFLSTKTPSELVTGEMGTGFFNIYRQAEHVVIVTGINNKRVDIVDTPIRDPTSGRVLDVSRQMTVKTENMIGTNIGVIFSSPQADDDLTEMFQIIQTRLAASRKFKVNGQDVEIEKTVFMSSLRNEFMSYRTDYPLASLLLTKGIPLDTLDKYIGNLPDYVRNELVSGIILDVEHGGYTPSQSRTKITMNPEQTARFERFITEVAYINALYKQLSKPDEPLSVHDFNSKGLMYALVPYVHNTGIYRNLWDFTGNYHYRNSESINGLLVKMITKYQYKTTPIGDLQKDPILKGVDSDMVKQTVIRWILRKQQSDPVTKSDAIVLNPVTMAPVTGGKIVQVAVRPEVVKFTVAFVNVYWEKLLELTIPEIHARPVPPSVAWGTLDNNVRGRYMTDSHSIELNLTYLSNLSGPAMTEEGIFLYFRGPGRDYFGESIPSALLPHELTHAWRLK
jgi:hypothetical protein